MLGHIDALPGVELPWAYSGRMPAAAREASAAPEDLSHDLLVTVSFMMNF